MTRYLTITSTLLGVTLCLTVGCDNSSNKSSGASGNATPVAAPNPPSPVISTTPPTPPSKTEAPITLQPNKTAPAPTAPPQPAPVVPPTPTPAAQPTASANPTPKVGPAWYADKTTHDFGEVWAGTQVPIPFAFKNIGSETLKILDIKPGCGCTRPEVYSKEVAPGAEGTLPLTVNTVNKPNGPEQIKVDVTTNDPAHPTVQYLITGKVRTVCLLDPPLGAIFGEVQPDQPLNRTVKMYNNSGKPLTLEPIPIPAGSFFKIDFKEVVPNQQWEFTATAPAPIPEGYPSTQIQLKTNIPEVPVYTVYASCVVPARITVAPPKIVVNPVSEQAKPRDVRIINNGKTPLNVLSVATSRPDLNVSYTPPGPPGPEMHGVFAEKAMVTHTINLTLPPNYQPPPWGELIQVKTDDVEKPVIDIYILPSLFSGPAARPADHPLTLTPIKMPGKA